MSGIIKDVLVDPFTAEEIEVTLLDKDLALYARYRDRLRVDPDSNHLVVAQKRPVKFARLIYPPPDTKRVIVCTGGDQFDFRPQNWEYMSRGSFQQYLKGGNNPVDDYGIDKIYPKGRLYYRVRLREGEHSIEKTFKTQSKALNYRNRWLRKHRPFTLSYAPTKELYLKLPGADYVGEITSFSFENQILTVVVREETSKLYTRIIWRRTVDEFAHHFSPAIDLAIDPGTLIDGSAPIKGLRFKFDLVYSGGYLSVKNWRPVGDPEAPLSPGTSSIFMASLVAY